MIEEVKHYGIFRVDLMRASLKLPHEEISKYCLSMIEGSGGYTTFHDDALNKKFKENFPYKEDFENDLCQAADKFVKETLRAPFEKGGGHSLNYWCSAYNEGDYHDSHIHPRSLISGTYYPQVSIDTSAITFEAPYTSRLMHDTLNMRFIVFDYKPQSGECLLWPSWLDHRVARQGACEKPRIAISFNIDYKENVLF